MYIHASYSPKPVNNHAQTAVTMFYQQPESSAKDWLIKEEPSSQLGCAVCAKVMQMSNAAQVREKFWGSSLGLMNLPTPQRIHMAISSVYAQLTRTPRAMFLFLRPGGPTA